MSQNFWFSKKDGPLQGTTGQNSLYPNTDPYGDKLIVDFWRCPKFYRIVIPQNLMIYLITIKCLSKKHNFKK